MEGKSSRSNAKRSFLEEDGESHKPPVPKRVRFPKGKKVKPSDEVLDKGNVEDDTNELMNPRLAAKERANGRSQITAELFSEDSRGILNDISAAEVNYEDNENFVDDGIQIEPFNLSKEREEGYFDAEGNFVEYVKDNEIKDAWLDNVEVDPKYAGLSSIATNDDDEAQDLSSKDIGIIKRHIANVLEPGETVLQALRRLKGNSDRKAKMSAETKIIFDQLTEDAMKLMENGEYNVYHEKREVFQHKAEGYEKLAQARGEGISLNSGEGNSYLNGEKDLLSNGMDSGEVSATVSSTTLGTSNPDASTAEVSGSDADDYDMFAEDDVHAAAKPSSDANNAVGQPSTDDLNSNTGCGELQNDYVYDESSGYSFNEETRTYDEVHEAASNGS